jgi:hypothetical protein
MCGEDGKMFEKYIPEQSDTNETIDVDIKSI